MTSTLVLWIALAAGAPTAPPAANQAVLYDFSAPWCGYCQQMVPVVHDLKRRGYPVQQVDVDQHPDLKQRFNVGPIPCFILVQDGRELGRITGATSEAELIQLFRRAPAGPAAASPAALTVTNAAGSPLLQTSVRLRVLDRDAVEMGSGTIIFSDAQQAIVLTCAHIFRDSGGRGRLAVDFFGRDPGTWAGEVIGYDLDSDVGLVRFHPGRVMTAVRVAPRAWQARADLPVVCIGCSAGQVPTAWSTRITGVNKYLGAANLECDLEPLQGRSGGGLFSSDGYVIGVCDNADPQSKRGIYAGPAAIRALLDRYQMTALYAPPAGSGVPAAATVAANRVAGTQVAMIPTPAQPAPTQSSKPRPIPPRDSQPAAGHDARPASLNWTASTDATDLLAPPSPETLGIRTPAAAEAAAAKALSDDEAEVVVVIRSLKDPRAKSRVVMLNRVSGDFLAQIDKQQQVQDARRVTTLKQPRRPMNHPVLRLARTPAAR